MNQRDTQETKAKPPEDEASLDRVQSERGDALKEILALVREMSERELAPVEQTNEHMYNILQEEEETLPVEFRNFAIDIFRRSNTLRRSLYERIAGVQHLFKSKKQKFKIEDEMLTNIDPRFLSPKDVQKLLVRVQQRVAADGGIEFSYDSTAKESALNNLIAAARSIQGGVRKNAEEDTWQAIAESCKETAIAYYRKTRIGRDYEKFPLVDDTPEILRDAYHTAVIRVVQQKEQDAKLRFIEYQKYDAELRFIEYQKYLEKNFDFDRVKELLSVGGSKTSVEALFGSDPIPHEYFGNLEDVVANMALHKAALQVADIQHHSWEVDDDTAKRVKAKVASDFPTYIRAVYGLLHNTPEACIQAFKGLLQVSSRYTESHRPIFQYMAGTHTHAYSGVERVNTYAFSNGETTIGELLQNSTGSTFTVDSPVQIQQILDFLEEIRGEFPYAHSISSLFIRRLDTDIAKEEKNNSTYHGNDHKTSELKEQLQLPVESEMTNRFADVLGDSSLSDSEFLASYVEWCTEVGVDIFDDIDEKKYRYIIFTGIQQYEHKDIAQTLQHELRDRVKEVVIRKENKSDIKHVFDDVLEKALVYVDIRMLMYFVEQYGEMDRVKAAMLKKTNSEIAFSTFLSLGKIAEYIDDPVKLLEIAKLRSLSESIEYNRFSSDELIEIAKLRPIRELLQASIFEPEVLKYLIKDRPDSEIVQTLTVSEAAEYIDDRSRLLEIAKLGPLSESIKCSEFTPDELLEIVSIRPFYELTVSTSKILEIFIVASGEAQHRYSSLIIKTLCSADPSLSHILLNPAKMGTKLDILANRLAVYATEAFARAAKMNTPKERVFEDITTKLREIKRIYTSSHSSQTDRVLIFAEGLSALDKNGKTIVVDEAVKDRIRGEVIDILVRSGCSRELVFFQRQLHDASISQDEKFKIKEKLKFSKDKRKEADVRNRGIAATIQQSNTRGVDILPPGAYTHGLPAEVLSDALDTGIMCGELLGSSSAKIDASGLFGTDTCKVPGRGWKDKRTLRDRLALGNETYGSVVAVIGDYSAPNGRVPWHARVVGEHHYNIPYGVATTEITSFISKSAEYDTQICDAVMWKGIYIPVVNMEGTVLLTPEAFDKKASIYQLLKAQGYEFDTAKGIVEYIQDKDTLSFKHQIVLDKALAAIQAGVSIELVSLIETMRDDSLNWHNDSWYAEQPFEVIYDFFKKDRTRLAQREVRKRLFGKSQATAIYKRNNARVSSHPKRQYHAHLDAFLDKQVSVSSVDTSVVESALTSVLMRELKHEKIFAASEQITKVKADALRRGLEVAWKHVFKSITSVDRNTLTKIQSQLVPVMTGSIGRGEAVLGSDLDFLFLFDDTAEDAVDRNILKQIIDTALTPQLNAYLESIGIRPDAGLAKADKNPFVALSDIQSFGINLSAPRQSEEPTELLDMQAIDVSGDRLVAKAKHALLVENKYASSKLVSYIARDLEVGSANRQSFAHSFEVLYKNFSSGVALSQIKESMQRTVTFKLYDLIARAFTPEFSIPETEAFTVPGPLPDKVSWLEAHGVITAEEGSICRDTLAVAYKLRMMSEFFSAESEQRTTDNIPAKVNDASIEKRMLSFEDRRRMFTAISEFRNKVLYK
jgi:hypothetical protein